MMNISGKNGTGAVHTLGTKWKLKTHITITYLTLSRTDIVVSPLFGDPFLSVLRPTVLSLLRLKHTAFPLLPLGRH